MKLAEFLNDDTCQILLAIIVGIVVCYFIFGSCSTCKDGFSVGGQACIKLPGQRLPSGSPQACYGLSEELCGRGPTTNICEWNQDVETPEEKCADYVMRIGSSLSQYGSECQAGEDIDATNSLCCFGEEGLPAGSLLVNDRLPGYRACRNLDVDPLLREQFNQIVQFKEDCDNNLESGIVQIPGTDAATPPPPTSISRDENIINDMVDAIKKVDDSYSLDSTFASMSTIEKVDKLVTDASRINLKFVLLINENFGQYKSSDIYNDFLTIPEIKMPGLSNVLKLGDLRKTYGLLNDVQQKQIYCNALLTRSESNGNQMYEPLLKMVTNDNSRLDYCSDMSGWDGCEPDKCNYKKNILQTDFNVIRSKLQSSYATLSAINDYIDTIDTSNPNYYKPPPWTTQYKNNNQNKVYLQSLDQNQKIQVEVNEDFRTEFYEEDEPNNRDKRIGLSTIEVGKTYELEYMYGMSILNPGMVYQTEKEYIWNLFWVQYYINRVLFNTSKYLPKNLNMFSGNPPPPSELISQYFDFTTNINDRNNSELYNRLSNTEFQDNTDCNDSGQDYLLLVFTESSTPAAPSPPPPPAARPPPPPPSTGRTGPFDDSCTNDRDCPGSFCDLATGYCN